MTRFMAKARQAALVGAAAFAVARIVVEMLRHPKEFGEAIDTVGKSIDEVSTILPVDDSEKDV